MHALMICCACPHNSTICVSFATFPKATTHDRFLDFGRARKRHGAKMIMEAARVTTVDATTTTVDATTLTVDATATATATGRDGAVKSQK